jgi:serine/threonine-protein kinase
VCAVVDRALAFKRTERYPDAETMRADIRAIRSGKPPPYVRAIAEGRIEPGAPMKMVPETAAPAHMRAARGVARTIVEQASNVGHPDGVKSVRPAPTLVDAVVTNRGALVAVIGASALTLGVVLGLVLTTCGSTDSKEDTMQAPPGQVDTGSGRPSKKKE